MRLRQQMSERLDGELTNLSGDQLQVDRDRGIGCVANCGDDLGQDA